MTGFSNAVETDVLNLVLRGTGYTRHTGDFLGSIPSGFAGLLQVYDSFWVETDTVFTLD
jgi:hypothetical protein